MDAFFIPFRLWLHVLGCTRLIPLTHPSLTQMSSSCLRLQQPHIRPPLMLPPCRCSSHSVQPPVLACPVPAMHTHSVLTLFRLWHPAPHTPKSMTSSPHWVSDTSAQETPYPAVALMAYTTASATLPLDALLTLNGLQCHTRTPPTLRMLIMAFGLKCLEREGMWREGAERKEEENHCSFYYLKMAQGGAGALCALPGQPALSVKSKPLQVF